MPEEQPAIIDMVPVGAMLRTVAFRRGEWNLLASMLGKSAALLADRFGGFLRLFPYRLDDSFSQFFRVPRSIAEPES